MRPDLILIVDDEPFNVDTLEQELQDQGFQTASAYSGSEAISAIKDNPPDLILLDIMMPGMDGFEVLKILKADSATESLPVIVISAAADAHNTIHGIELGADDYLPKPFNPVLLKARIHSCLERKHYRDLEKDYLRALRTEMDMARKIQACFLPSVLPTLPGWHFDTLFRSAKDVSGDFYDVFSVKTGGLVCLVGDVCGKGVGAALFMTLFRSLLRIRCMDEETDPRTLILNAVTFANQYIAGVHEADNMFATLFVLHVPAQGGDVNYINCGNEPGILVEPDKDGFGELKPCGPACGIFLEAKYEARSITMNPGAMLAIFTDGIPDAEDTSGQPWGRTGIKQILSTSETPSIATQTTTTRLQAYTHGVDPVDDITLLIIQRDGTDT